MSNAGEVEVFMYIPDMTGFTEFMTSTRPEKSHSIVEEMLKVITEANRLQLRISDIVGDAVFFFRVGKPPSIDALIEQSKLISGKFKEQLKAHGSRFNWETNRVEQLHQLNIKFIAHFGKVAISEIENHVKLIGVPAIEAHRLLKNSVVSANYLLITNEYAEAAGIGEPDFQHTDGADSYDHIGEKRYKIINLDTVVYPQ